MFGRHGVFEHERRDGQEFTIDLRLTLSVDPARYSLPQLEARHGFNQTTPATFAGDLVKGVALVVVGLTYVPVLVLGPIVESLS